MFLLSRLNKQNIKPIITGFKYFSTQVIQTITITVNHAVQDSKNLPLDQKNLKALQDYLVKQAEGFVGFVAPHEYIKIAGESSTVIIPDSEA